MKFWHPAAGDTYGSLPDGTRVSFGSDLEVRAAVGHAFDLATDRLSRAGRRWVHRDGGLSGRGYVAAEAWRVRDYLNRLRSIGYPLPRRNVLWLVNTFEALVLSALGQLAAEQSPAAADADPDDLVDLETVAPAEPDRVPTPPQALVSTLVAAPAAPPVVLLCQ